ncbi:MAG: hypothetical protein ABI696_10490, partial [Rubrivivax sp.]
MRTFHGERRTMILNRKRTPCAIDPSPLAAPERQTSIPPMRSPSLGHPDSGGRQLQRLQDKAFAYFQNEV